MAEQTQGDQQYNQLINDGNTSNNTGVEGALEDIKNLLKDIKNASQSSAQDMHNTSPGSWRDVGRAVYPRREAAEANRTTKTFLDGFEKAIGEAVGADAFKESIKKSLSEVAEAFDTDLNGLGETLGERFGQDLAASFKNNNFARSWAERVKESQQKWLDRSVQEWQAIANDSDKPFDWVSGFGDDLSSNLHSSLDDLSSLVDHLVPDDGIAGRIKNSRAASGVGNLAHHAVDAAGDVAGGALQRASQSGIGQAVLGSAIGADISGALLSGLSAAGGPAGIAAAIGLSVAENVVDMALGHIVEQFEHLQQAFSDFMDGLNAAADRDATSRQKRIEAGNERLRKDISSIVEEPFTVLKEAAQTMLDAWDANLRVINQTQGYSKAELQDLISSFSQRIRSEGLESVVSSADLTSNLGNVLKSGLSGQVAEEFSYIATKLNAAIPTQDFFQYGTTYASLAANAIKDGKSQSEALEYANQQLELFASDILYASRQLTGGFSTGLQNASDLFQKAVEISVASRTNNPSEIAGVLTSVSAITESIAPGIGSSIVDAVYNAAVGGNSSQIVALRSLAGINASNTEFLQSISNDPQEIFSTLFKNLAEMQNMSQDNYMEVAEGLQDVFGISMDAFSRIDFNYLAKAIDQMNVNTSSLDENLKLLASGESTLTAEQMRIRQINEYMLDEGLSYVLDNEVARAIQQHMWDEQLAIEMQEATYAVDLRGEALSFLNEILNVGRNILGFLNPVTNIVKAFNLAQTAVEAMGMSQEVKAVLEAGKVGSGNSKVLKNLTTVGTELHLTNSYLSMLQQTHSTSGGSVSYNWGVVSKSLANSLGTAAKGYTVTSRFLESSSQAQNVNLVKLQNQFDKMQATMSDFFGTSTYDKVQQVTAARTETKLAELDTDFRSQAEKLLASNEDLQTKYGINSDVVSSRLQAALDKSSSDYVDATQEALKENAINSISAQLEAQARADIRATEQTNVLKDLINRVNEFKDQSSTGYDAWAATAGKFGFSDFSEAIKELGYSADDLQNYFESLETQASAESEIERQRQEEAFWSNTQESLANLNTNLIDVFDKGDIMGIVWPGVDTWFSILNENLADFKSKWYDEYFIRYLKQHETYSSHFGVQYNESGEAISQAKEYTDMLAKVQKAEKDSNEDAINALAEAITQLPIDDLMDPTVQQNVFLAQILTVVQAIFQQNNTQGKLKLPDAIAALATGMTTVDTNSATTASSSKAKAKA